MARENAAKGQRCREDLTRWETSAGCAGPSSGCVREGGAALCLSVLPVALGGRATSSGVNATEGRKEGRGGVGWRRESAEWVDAVGEGREEESPTVQRLTAAQGPARRETQTRRRRPGWLDARTDVIGAGGGEQDVWRLPAPLPAPSDDPSPAHDCAQTLLPHLRLSISKQRAARLLGAVQSAASAGGVTSSGRCTASASGGSRLATRPTPSVTRSSWS